MGQPQVLQAQSTSPFVVNVELQLLKWEKDAVYFVFAPALDVVGYGVSEEEAEASFSFTLKQTLNSLKAEGKVYEELERLGWLINRYKRMIQTPDFQQLLLQLPELEEIAERASFSEKHVQLELL